MVLPASGRVSRVPPYSGFPRASQTFAYGALTLYGWPSHAISLVLQVPDRAPQPRRDSPTVWAIPRSLAATYGVSLDFLSCGYLDVSVPHVDLARLCIQLTMTRHDARRVSPFGHPRLDAYVQLPVASRR